MIKNKSQSGRRIISKGDINTPKLLEVKPNQQSKEAKSLLQSKRAEIVNNEAKLKDFRSLIETRRKKSPDD